MKRNRIILYVAFGVFHLAMFLFTLYMESQKENWRFLIGMLKVLWTLKYLTFIGLGLFLTDLIWLIIDKRKMVKEQDRLNQELTSLKAKLFDMQEGAKQSELPNSGGTEV